MKPRKTGGDFKIRLRTLNELITCGLCRGYLIDAVSITECLHTFCKSCIVKYLNDRNDCPICQIMIHQSHPLNYISTDRTLQDIVYKVVPNLRNKERKRREDFYRKMGRSPPANEVFLADTYHLNGDNDHHNNGSVEVGKKNGGGGSSDSGTSSLNHQPGGEGGDGTPGGTVAQDPDFHRHDDQVNICLEPGSDRLAPLNRKFIRLSSMATVTHLRKYVANLVLNDISKFKEIDIFFKRSNDQIVLLGKDHLLKFINVVHWRALGQGDNPMPLQYLPHTNHLL